MSRPIVSAEEAKLRGMPKANLERPSRAKSAELEALPGGRPKMPTGLREEQQSLWKQIVKQLRRRRTVTPGDAQIITLYVRTHSQWMRACDYVDERGPIVQEKRYSAGSGAEYFVDVPNPALKLAASLAGQLESFLKEMGLTGITREKVRPVKSSHDKEPPIVGTAAWFREQPDLVEPTALPEIEIVEDGDGNDGEDVAGAIQPPEGNSPAVQPAS
jgi:P27 family predicted phage terminase small subunit